MRFMLMHKVDAQSEAGIPPSMELMMEMGKLIEDGVKAGVFVGGEGLKPTAQRVRLVFSKGKRTITKGPLRGNNEVLAGFSLLKVRSLDEAIEWATRFAAVVGDVEIELGPVNEPWDFGMPKPEGDIPVRVLALHKADKRSEAGERPTPETLQAMSALISEMTAAGVFGGGEALEPSSKGSRITIKQGHVSVVDGPFAESKELISGYAILQLPSQKEAIEWATRFAKLTGSEEIDVREVSER